MTENYVTKSKPFNGKRKRVVFEDMKSSNLQIKLEEPSKIIKINEINAFLSIIDTKSTKKIKFTKYEKSYQVITHLLNAFIRDISEDEYKLEIYHYIIYFPKAIYSKMMSLEINQNKKIINADIDQLIFNGTSCFTKGTIIIFNESRECNISIHRFGVKDFLFLVSIEKESKKKENECMPDDETDIHTSINKFIQMECRKSENSVSCTPMFYRPPIPSEPYPFNY